MNNPAIYILRFIYRIKYWLILCPLAVATFVYFSTSDLQRIWESDTTIYTGVVSGFDIESATNVNASQATINNAMDNIINIISLESTLKRVSMRLFAQHMIYGDPTKDTKHITAKHYQMIYNKVAANKDVLALIDKTSEENTLKNLYAYEEASRTNFVYGLFNWTPQHYSYSDLKKISIKKLGNSDMLSLSYKANDPGVAYNTLILLTEEFNKQYEELRFGETNNVIKYFESELARLYKDLNTVEDQFTEYNTAKQIINYPEQTKYVSAMQRDFDLKYEEILLTYTGAKRLVETIEKRIDYKMVNIRNNILFVGRMKEITDITEQISEMESFSRDSTSGKSSKISVLQKQLLEKEKSLKLLSENILSQQYSKEGVSSVSLVDQWLAECIRFEKAEAELSVMDRRKAELDQKYIFFSPIGATIKRMEREINFTEQSYLSVLASLNAAKLRRRNLQMTSATLKVLNPPIYPIAPEPHARRLIVCGAAFAAFVFILGIFIILELLDRTIRNKQRAERLTGLKVVGATPKRNVFGYRAYDQEWMSTAAQYIGNQSMTNVNPLEVNIINILSTEYFEGKSHLAETLKNYFSEEGFKVKILIADSDFIMRNKGFHLTTSIKELIDTNGFDVIIVEYSPLCKSSIPLPLLNEAMINLLTVRANRSWKDTDQIIIDNLTSSDVKLNMILTEAERFVVETFTGLLPPYTFLRRFGYRIYQMGLTSTEYFNKPNVPTDDNNE